MFGDGVTHINVYSRGETELGRQLSNFAHTPFQLDGRWFESVEGWWYWRKTGDEQFQKLWGFEAKRQGQEAQQRFDAKVQDPTRDELKRVYRAKLEHNPKLKEMLRKSTLSFEHYYVYNGLRKETHHRWTGQLWGEVRDEL